MTSHENSNFNYIIILPIRMKGARMDLALSVMFPVYSRSKITSWIKSGDATINGKNFKPKDKSAGNEIIKLNIPDKVNNDWIPENIPFDIVFEDEDIIVINNIIIFFIVVFYQK